MNGNLVAVVPELLNVAVVGVLVAEIESGLKESMQNVNKIVS